MFHLLRKHPFCIPLPGVAAAVLCALLPMHARTRQRAPYDPGTLVSEPRLFATGTISTDLDESGGTFSPDGHDFYFTLLAPYTTGPHLGVLCVSRFQGGAWQEPQVLPFSGKSLDFGTQLSADGAR